MRYLYKRGDTRRRRVMHIEAFDRLGRETMLPLCPTRLAFDSTINAPWRLGRRVCKRCVAAAEGRET